jgi:spore coat polysaccharide biosynthesis predicted glycosyltransferase SpsG
MFFGGADTINLTGLSVAAFQQLGRRDIHLDVVVTETTTQFRKVEKAIEGWSNIRLFGPLPSLCPLMVKADLAVGAGGATVWERFCLGLPSVVISIAENQKLVCEGLARSGLIEYIGHADQVEIESLRNTLIGLISLPNISEWSRDCHAICDGEGVGRLVEIILTEPN